MPFGPRPYPESKAIIDRIHIRYASLIVVLLIAIGGLVNGVLAESRASRTEQRATAACKAWYLVGTLPVTGQTTDTGLGLISAGRDAYYGLACQTKHGQLPPADPRVVAWALAHQKGNR